MHKLHISVIPDPYLKKLRKNWNVKLYTSGRRL